MRGAPCLPTEVFGIHHLEYTYCCPNWLESCGNIHLAFEDRQCHPHFHPIKVQTNNHTARRTVLPTSPSRPPWCTDSRLKFKQGTACPTPSAQQESFWSNHPAPSKRKLRWSGLQKEGPSRNEQPRDISFLPLEQSTKMTEPQGFHSPFLHGRMPLDCP